jgi:hypothetical protein
MHLISRILLNFNNLFKQWSIRRQVEYISLVYCKILWRIDALLGKGNETNNETIAVAMQQLGKHASTTIQLCICD